MPPESCDGYALAKSFSPMKASASSTRRRTSASSVPWRRSPKAALSHTVSQGKLASSWNTTPMPSGTVPATGRPSHGEKFAAPEIEVDRSERMDRLGAGRPWIDPRHARELGVGLLIRRFSRHEPPSFLQIRRQERAVDDGLGIDRLVQHAYID